MRCKSVLLMLAILALEYNPLQALLLWLEDGSILQVEVVELEEKKVVFRRLDNDGIIHIPWNEIHPRCRKELKKRLGVTPQEKIVYKISGIKVYLKTGGIVLGKILKQTPDYFLVKTKTTDISIPITNILTSEKIPLDIAQIYKPDEVYQEFQSQYDLGTADGNLKFGEFLLRTGNHAKAKIHLEKAKSLDTALSNTVQTLMETLSKEADSVRYRKELSLYHSYKNRRQFGKAWESLHKLQNVLSSTEWQKYEKELNEEQFSYFAKEIATSWIQAAYRKIGQIVYNKKITLKEAQDSTGDIEKYISEAIASEFQIKPEEALNYFEKRDSTSLHRYSYRSGTFIVGITGRLPEGSRSKEISKSSLPKVKSGYLSTPEEWWQKTNTSMRQEWLMAYYCENRFQIVDQELKPCSNCSGKGFQGDTLCPACHGIRMERTVVVK